MPFAFDAADVEMRVMLQSHNAVADARCCMDALQHSAAVFWSCRSISLTLNWKTLLVRVGYWRPDRPKAAARAKSLKLAVTRKLDVRGGAGGD